MSDEIIRTRSGPIRIGDDDRVWIDDWTKWRHVGWLDREDDGFYRVRAPEGSSLGAHPSRDVAVEAMLRSER